MGGIITKENTPNKEAYAFAQLRKQDPHSQVMIYRWMSHL